MAFGNTPAIAGLLYGIKPVVAVWRIGGRTLHNFWLGAISLATLCAIFFFALPSPAIILTATTCGWFAPQYFTTASSQTAHTQSHDAALLIGLPALGALVRWPSRVVPVIAASAIAGLLVYKHKGPDGHCTDHSSKREARRRSCSMR